MAKPEILVMESNKSLGEKRSSEPGREDKLKFPAFNSATSAIFIFYEENIIRSCSGV